jgi:integrase
VSSRHSRSSTPSAAPITVVRGFASPQASGRLGHSSIAITADLYQHVAADMDTDAAERAARALRGPA